VLIIVLIIICRPNIEVPSLVMQEDVLKFANLAGLMFWHGWSSTQSVRNWDGDMSVSIAPNTMMISSHEFAVFL
jgi:hypothetical protein